MVKSSCWFLHGQEIYKATNTLRSYSQVSRMNPERSDGSWSAPSAICSVGLGWGAQIGGELMDFIIVLHDLKAVKTFCSRMHFSLGAGVVLQRVLLVEC
ncbi:hypothetical protein M0R45_003752 [Rubus argutus]|uniref:Ysc84 actin-binding domain-containing protein n=1 Tax=Rubus argutus TaxID=59490 RepID=A0AAW1YI70_RUBAR